MRRRRDWRAWGKRLAEFRGRAGWTQEDLAARVGTARVTIARLETGVRRPSVDLLERIAAAFGLTLEEVLGRRR